jgi:hypothetical protein
MEDAHPPRHVRPDRPNASLEGAAEMDAADVWPNANQDVLAIGYGFPEDRSPSSITWF